MAKYRTYIPLTEDINIIMSTITNIIKGQICTWYSFKGALSAKIVNLCYP
jgi:hypothetical protein